MRMWLTTRKLLGIVFAALLVVSTILTLIDTPLSLWHRFNANGDDKEVAPSRLREPSQPVAESPLLPIPVPSPTPVPSLPTMLEAAKSVKIYSEKDRAMRIVAETAVKQGDYEIAIEAGVGSASYEGQSDTLAYVARCAAEQGQFEYAVKAADEIPIAKVHDNTKIEILMVKSIQENSEPGEVVDTATYPGCRSP